MLGKRMWHLCKRIDFSWIWFGFHMKSCHMLLSRWELSFCPPCPSGVAHRVPELCVPGCAVVFEPHNKAGPKERAGDCSRQKPRQSTRHSPVANLLGVSVGQVLWSSNIWITKGKQCAWLVRFRTKGILEKELPALVCSLPEDRKLFSILLTPSLPWRTLREPRSPEELERGAIALSPGTCLNPSSAVLTSEKLSWDKVLLCF